MTPRIPFAVAPAKSRGGLGAPGRNGRGPAAPKYVRAFTLLEVLVAVAIFVIVGALAMGGYNELVKQSGIVDSSATRTRAIQAAMQRLVQDVTTLEPRPVREPLGDAIEPALIAESGNEQLVQLTHAGWPNPAGLPRPTLQRVAYRLQDGKLRREYWAVLDRTLTVEPASAVLLDNVRGVGFRFLDASQTWHDQWPPPTGVTNVDALRARPVAVEITLDLEDWGTVQRVVEIPG